MALRKKWVWDSVLRWEMSGFNGQLVEEAGILAGFTAVDSVPEQMIGRTRFESAGKGRHGAGVRQN